MKHFEIGLPGLPDFVWIKWSMRFFSIYSNICFASNVCRNKWYELRRILDILPCLACNIAVSNRFHFSFLFIPCIWPSTTAGSSNQFQNTRHLHRNKYWILCNIKQITLIFFDINRCKSNWNMISILLVSRIIVTLWLFTLICGCKYCGWHKENGKKKRE